MADTYKKLAQGQAATTVAVVYTVPASTTAMVKQIHIANTSGATVTIKLWQSGTADANIILPAVTLDGGEFGQFDGNLLMETADTLQAESDTATAVTITVYGLEMT